MSASCTSRTVETSWVSTRSSAIYAMPCWLVEEWIALGIPLAE
jgi:hypothetical protein